MATSNDPLKLSEAINLLYRFDIHPHDTKRSAKDRTSKRIKYHLAKGKIKLNDNGEIQLGELVDWARQQNAFKDKLNELPMIYTHEQSGGIQFGGAATVEFKKAMPSSIEDCHKVIETLSQQNQQLQSKNTSLQNEKLELEPDALAWRKSCKKNKQNASKPRKR